MNTQILTDRIKNNDVLNNLASFFPNDIYLVGGAVRDLLLNKDVSDMDIVVVGVDTESFAKQVSEFFVGKLIVLDSDNEIFRIILSDKTYIDIAKPVGKTLEDDLKRRDLTINSLAVNIKTCEIIDCTNSLYDIENQTIKAISEENFTDDPLRLLRVFRFYSILGFKIDEELKNIVKKHSSLITQPAKERVQYELMKMFDGKYCAQALIEMDNCELLDKIFSFVKELKQIPPNLHHHLDLFHHSVETVRQVQLLYENSIEEVQEHMQRVDFGGFSRLAHLKLASFMHDIGKFSTWTIEEDTGRHRFIKHDDVGAKLAPAILKEYCFSNKQIEYISYIIKKHMYPTAVVCSPDLSEKVLMRYVRKSGENAIDNILISQADRLSARGPEITEEIVEENITSLNNLLKFYLAKREGLEPLPKLLDGNEIMEILDMPPSKKLGVIISKLEEAQISQEVVSKEDAIEFVKNITD